MPHPNPKLKILVNWQTRQIIHTIEPVGSAAYRDLINKGYTEVGQIKDAQENKVFWRSEYFEPRDKYQRGIPKVFTDEIQTHE